MRRRVRRAQPGAGELPQRLPEPEFNTRVGTIDVSIPKLRHGSYFPDWLLARRTGEKALVAVVDLSKYVERRYERKGGETPLDGVKAKALADRPLWRQVDANEVQSCSGLHPHQIARAARHRAALRSPPGLRTAHSPPAVVSAMRPTCDQKNALTNKSAGQRINGGERW